MNYFFDSYSVIEILKNSPNYEKFKDIQIITSALNMAEVYYVLASTIDEESAAKAVQNLVIRYIDIYPEIAIEAARFRFKHRKLKMSYADCIGYIISKRAKLRFLTGDEAFIKMENVEFVK